MCGKKPEGAAWRQMRRSNGSRIFPHIWGKKPEGAAWRQMRRSDGSGIFPHICEKKLEGAARRLMRRRKGRQLAESFHTYVVRKQKELPGDR